MLAPACTPCIQPKHRHRRRVLCVVCSHPPTLSVLGSCLRGNLSVCVCTNLTRIKTTRKVELNVDMLDPLTFRVVERLIRQALQGGSSAAAGSASGASAASTASAPATSSSSSSKSKSGGSGSGGGSSGPKKRKNADGESRPKKQRS